MPWEVRRVAGDDAEGRMQFGRTRYEPFLTDTPGDVAAFVAWHEEARPVPHRPDLPADRFVVFP